MGTNCIKPTKPRKNVDFVSAYICHPIETAISCAANAEVIREIRKNISEWLDFWVAFNCTVKFPFVIYSNMKN